MKYKLWGSSATIFVVLLMGAVMAFAVGPQNTSAFVVGGADCGLRVERALDPVDTSNLNPGDKKSSYLMVHNDGSRRLDYFFNIVKVEGRPGFYRGETGGTLDEVLSLIVRRRGEVLYQGPLHAFRELAMGSLQAGNSEQIEITIALPGGRTDNTYQGSSVTVRFAFRAVCDSPPSSPKASLLVFKYHDKNKNGVWDPDEPEIAGWKVYINDWEYFTPVNLQVEPGQYTITEETRESWIPSTATTFTVSVSGGAQQTVLFGNYQESESGSGDDPYDPPLEQLILEPDKPVGSPPPEPDVPEITNIPQTGETPPAVFYGIGLLLITAGFLLALRERLK